MPRPPGLVVWNAANTFSVFDESSPMPEHEVATGANPNPLFNEYFGVFGE